MPNIRVRVFFSDLVQQNDIPVLKKVEIRSATRAIIKRVVDGTEEITDFNFAAVNPNSEIYRPQTDTVSLFSHFQNGNTVFKIGGFIPEGDKPANIDTTYSDADLPVFPYLADGETATAEEPTVTPDWLPTEEQRIANLVARWKQQVATAADTFDVKRIESWAKEASKMAGSTLDAIDMTNTVESAAARKYHNTVDWARSWIGAAWREIERFEDDHDDKLTEAQVADIVDKCVTEIGLGIKFWYHQANLQTAHATLWATYIAVYQIWTTGATGAPGVDWRATNALPALTQSEFEEILTTYYNKAQAHSVGVTL